MVFIPPNISKGEYFLLHCVVTAHSCSLLQTVNPNRDFTPTSIAAMLLKKVKKEIEKKKIE